ncbi:MAG TPA: ABC transporter permease [Bacteroidota bacterium]|nr:ABC transporter permease [Bacteroidota bacterium]
MMSPARLLERPSVRSTLSAFLALAVSIGISTVLILLVGRDPGEVYDLFIKGTLGSPYGVGQVLFKATPLIYTGLAAAICFKAGLFNIGAEGQLTIGAFCTAAAGFYSHMLPPFLAIPFCLLAGIIGGGIWGLLPGMLKAFFGVHEVINTIMMNFIAAGLVNFLVGDIFSVPATVHTPDISGSSFLPRFGAFSGYFTASPVNVSILLAIGTCFLTYFYIYRTVPGYETRAAGLNPNASLFAGIRPSRVIIRTFFISGAVAGLVGSNYVMGYKHYFELGFSEGAGFIGIAVALLARNNPIVIILTALLFGLLEYGSLTINTMIPKELANILQAIVIISIIVLTKIFDRLQLRLGKGGV